MDDRLASSFLSWMAWIKELLYDTAHDTAGSSFSTAHDTASLTGVRAQTTPAAAHCTALSAFRPAWAALESSLSCRLGTAWALTK